MSSNLELGRRASTPTEIMALASPGTRQRSEEQDVNVGIRGYSDSFCKAFAAREDFGDRKTYNIAIWRRAAPNPAVRTCAELDYASAVGQRRKLRSVFAILLLQVDVVVSGLGVGVFGLPGSVAVEFALALVIDIVIINGRAGIERRKRRSMTA